MLTPQICQHDQTGFTLIELLVTIAVLSLLLAISMPATFSALSRADDIKCQSTLRRLGTAVLQYAAEHDGEIPRSTHSAQAHQQRGWIREIFPYLGYERDVATTGFREIQAQEFRCAADRTRMTGSSYGLNVYYELDPDYDDYTGTPQRWRRLQSVPNLSRSILLAEVPGSADHVMAHFWSEGGNGFDVASERHANRSNYLFADGHLEPLALDAIYAPSKGIDLWNPSLAK